MSLNPLDGQAVLCTGGSGSFAKAFTQRALESGARKVVLLSRGEAAQSAMRAQFNNDKLRFIIADIRDPARLHEACRGIDILIHAASLKRVEVCEADPVEAIATNIQGTLNVARACIAQHIKKAIFLSTDKAAAPVTLYGASKFAAERLWVGMNIYAAGTPTQFAASRYGNVCNSTGSVIPLWRKQSEDGIPLTITDPHATRFLMRMEQAVDLVITALTKMGRGQVFVPRLGSASMASLANAVSPDSDQMYIGLRPGEKMHESLICPDEARYTYIDGDHYVIEPCLPIWEDAYEMELPRVPEGFDYRSDTAPRLTTQELQRMIA